MERFQNEDKGCHSLPKTPIDFKMYIDNMIDFGQCET
jgi:hypothetical protein